MNSASRKSILTTFMQKIWNEGDFSSLKNLVSTEYSVSLDEYDPWSGQIIDHDTFERRVLYSRNAFPDLHFEIKEMIEEGQRVAVSWVMSGTHIGDLPQLRATKRAFSIIGLTFYYFDEYKVCGHAQCFDQFAFLKQMGIFG